MSRKGVWQLQKLVLNYCEFSGSSRGVREFVQNMLPAFQEVNPHLKVQTALSPGRHPWWHAQYLTGNERSVDLRNNDAGEVLRQAVLLRSSAGRKASLKIKHRHVTKTPSIQGAWQAGQAAQEGSYAAAAAAAGQAAT